jgi:putative Mn2+ efflux pump MntP
VSWFDYVGVCLGVAISLLASACALGRGLLGLSPLHAYQLSWRFALLQFVLLAAGWLAGVEAARAIGLWSCWAGILIMALVAFKMLWVHRTNHIHSETSGLDGLAMLLAVANSIKVHALVLGFVLALLGSRSVVAALIAGMFAAVLTVVGIVAGSRKGLRVARGIQSAGGCVLLLIVARGFFSRFCG